MNQRFPTTRWSRIVAAGDAQTDDARDALAELCDAYWYPIYAFLRRGGLDADSALDRTQDYFVHLMERRPFAAADPTRGRFRAFLLTDCRHFLAHRRERDNALRRGGGRRPVSIDANAAEGRYRLEPSHSQTAERLFERDWALTLLENVLAGLRREYEQSGRGDIFETLKGDLVADGRPAVSRAELARRLGVDEAAARVAAHRLRRRYREAVRAAIAATVADEADVDDELRALLAALGE